ncbi:trypsin [Herbihabitans rhizosphaerae]|uniref:Trypsin n=1 Tax=Herbihabitans rhizosphaerae TaxID=1872711 RepID=A0A4V2ESZ9_9PSEU|nr:serine protease [Herbihabitans rhizosphaerae]RZS39333.1 trypsin [Herbihabitans rhizosphaerae]
MRTAIVVAALAAGVLAPGTAVADQPGTVSPFIIGGEQSPAPYTFMARLGDGCGATLISPEWALTAGHCVGVGSRLRIGSLDRTSGGEVAQVAQAIRHPDYQGGATPHDIALLKLSAPAKSTPAKLADKATDESPTRLLGWGATSGGGSQSQKLKQLDTAVIADSNCSSGQTEDPFDPAGDLCIETSPGSSACNGDSGGPALAGSDGNWTQIGVTSRGATGCDGSQPTIYTDVGAHIQWIKETTGLTFSRP